jgi:hypothetical protein
MPLRRELRTLLHPSEKSAGVFVLSLGITLSGNVNTTVLCKNLGSLIGLPNTVGRYKLGGSLLLPDGSIVGVPSAPRCSTQMSLRSQGTLNISIMAP